VGASVFKGLSEAEKISLRIRLNLLGRKSQPTTEQRRAYCDLVVIGNPELSDATIATAIGLSQQTVNRRLHELTRMGKLKAVPIRSGETAKGVESRRGKPESSSPASGN
jgi:DNA-binding transcriptional ArsR family regulator